MHVRSFCLVWVLLVAGCTVAPPEQSSSEQVQPQVTRLPLLIDGKPTEVVADIYKPAGAGPFPLVIFSHGRAGSRIERARLRHPIAVGHADYWLRQGVAVVAPERPAMERPAARTLRIPVIAGATGGAMATPTTPLRQTTRAARWWPLTSGRCNSRGCARIASFWKGNRWAG